jgi:FkbH-like protein
MKTLAQQLNIGFDSMVFIDDDPMNRQLMREVASEVLTIELPEDPALYARALLTLNDFEVLSLTTEDRERGQMYAQERQRKELATEVMDIKSFIKNLGIKVTIGQADSFTMPRISQLTQRTNQFNFTTKRYTVEALNHLVEKENARIYWLKASDRFGDYGIVGVAIILEDGGKWHLDTYLMSCRILGRGVEKSFVYYLAREAYKRGISEITAEFKTSEKNAPAEEFFNCVFTDFISQEDGTKIGKIATEIINANKPQDIEILDEKGEIINE